mgnify:CR=1 FL=1
MKQEGVMFFSPIEKGKGRSSYLHNRSYNA